MKYLIVGLGSIGRRHFHNLITLGERDILFYRTHRSTLPDAELEGFPEETDFGAALEHKPDAVIIANPTALHLEAAIPSAQAGCHLLLEKPVSQSLHGVDGLQRAVKANDCKVLVGFQFRYHPGLLKIRQLLADQAIGRLLSVRAHWGEYLPAWHPWEDYRKSYSARAELGGGVVLTLCHPLDYLRWMIGEVEALWAFTGRLNDLEMNVEDTAEIGLRFENGVLGSVHLDYNQQPASHKVELIGTKGTLAWDNRDGIVQRYSVDHQTWESFSPPAGFERNNLFLTQMRHFVDLIAGKSASHCSLDDGIRALQLVLMVQESQRSRKLVYLSGFESDTGIQVFDA